ncbi:MAG: glycoside hydrolase family 3 C-terminal domain-containing protein [Bacteroidales bacterium]|nr:glycoside hydrolase family 3 C-terminal domain-containing protein [Bacteroidales bacterium]
MKRLALLLILSALSVSCEKGNWRDSSLPAAERAKLLLKEMTLEEKVGQMCQYVAPCYVPPGQGSPYKNIDATDENLGNKDLADKIRRGEVGSFLHCMTTKEAIALQEMAKESRLGIPLLIGIDAIHGNALIEGCTIYPTNINMASTFDPELMEKIGAETALEMRQKGLYWTFAPNLDVARDARWGRMGETYGEDPFLVTEMGKHSILGLQGPDRNFDEGHVIACAKHLIAGGEPFGGLNAAPMDVSERQLREIYLPPFIAAVEDAHVGTVMAAHNEINGIPCHGNSWLLKDLLREELGFDGFVVSDWMDIERLHAMHHWAPDSTEAFVRSVEAGIDMHMQGDNYFEAVIGAVNSGRIPMKRIDEAAGKILEMKFAVGLFEAPLPSMEPLENASEHRQTALQAAREGIVLLKNNGILPLRTEITMARNTLAGKTTATIGSLRGGTVSRANGGAEQSEAVGQPKVLPAMPIRRIFVVGPNADSQTILGDWAAPQPDSLVITVLEGLRNEFPGTTIDTMCFSGMISNVDAKGIAVARHKASAADVCIVVAGENSQRYSAFGRTCGENCDRDDLDLPGMQEQLLEAVASTGKPTILVLMTGRANSIAWAKDNVDAILNVWEPGQMGGQAVAEVISGKVNPSGKLPVTMPRSVGQVPTVYNHKHSQYSRLFATNETGPLWPFGFGLSYSCFRYSGLKFLSADGTPDGETTAITVRITNEGPFDGAEVVQLYIRDEYASVTRPVKELKAFKRIFLKNGESTDVTFDITPEMLQCFGADNRWTVEPGEFTIMVGSSSADEDLQSISFTSE